MRLRLNQEAYAKFEPRAASQKSLMTWLEPREPRRLDENVCVSKNAELQRRFKCL